MKTTTTYLIASLLLSLMVGSSSAQESQDLPLLSSVPSSTKNLDINTKSASIRSNIILTDAVSKAFEANFTNAEKVRWYEKSTKDLVKFVMNDQEHIAMFNKNGSLFYHVTYGLEKDLPLEVKKLVETNYPNYDITKVINIAQGGRNFWVLNIENPQYFKIVNVEDGRIKEMDRFKTASIVL